MMYCPCHCRASEVAAALSILGWNGDDIFARIRDDLAAGLTKEARAHLNFVDQLLRETEGES